LSGGYQSNDSQNDNHNSYGDSNGDRACQHTDRDAESNKKNNDDSMSFYTCKTGFIGVWFMYGRGRGFDIARALKEFVNAARRQDAEFSLLPLHGSTNNICNTMDVPGNGEDIERYYGHEVNANNANGKMRIRSCPMHLVTVK
jgi:hypothetical protein